MHTLHQSLLKPQIPTCDPHHHIGNQSLMSCTCLHVLNRIWPCHCYSCHKDIKHTAGCRGLQAMLTRRRKLLQYMRRSDFDAYSALLLRLRLRDNYAKQVRRLSFIEYCPLHVAMCFFIICLVWQLRMCSDERARVWQLCTCSDERARLCLSHWP